MGPCGLVVRPAVRSDESAVLELVKSIYDRAANSWTAIDGWASGWAELLRTARVSVIQPPSPMNGGRQYEAEGAGQEYGSGIWAIVAARKLPSVVPGWRVEVEILAAPALGSSHLRACEREAFRLARCLSARQMEIRWSPNGTPGREDRIVGVRRA